MLDAHLLALYIPFSALLVVTPGPDTLNILTLSVAKGKMAGFRCLAGHASSAGFSLAAAALGISSIFAASVLAFSILRLLGAAYLIYLGLRQILAQEPSGQLEEAVPAGGAFWQGFLTHLTNPKVAIFYLSVIPQFVNPKLGNVWLQALMLGAIQKLMAFVWLFGIALAAGKAGAWLKGHETFMNWQRRVTGAFFVLFGLKLAWAKRA